MQITSSNWQNPAAHAAQSISQARSPQSTTNSPTPGGVNALEHAAKTGDRDANERYDGPPGHESNPQSPNQDEAHPLAMMDLPADDGEPGELDLRG